MPTFKVCWRNTLGYAVNNAANLHMFMQQSAVTHTGNVRGSGPNAPMMAVPTRTPLSQQAMQDSWIAFIQQLVLETGWQPGAPTNLWIVDFKK